MELKVGNLNPKYAFTNKVYVNSSTYNSIVGSQPNRPNNAMVKVSGLGIAGEWFYILTYESDTNSTPNNEIGFNAIQRKCLSVTIGQDVRIELYVPPTEMAVSVMNISVDLLRKAPSGQPIKIESAELMESFMTQYDGQIFRIGQQFPMNFNGEKLDLVINTLDHVNIGMGGSKPKTFSNDSGQVIRNVSSLTFSKRKDSTSALIIIAPAEGRNDNLFRQDFDFEKMDIGGLGKEFEVIFRRAFASRVFPGLIKELGVNHVRGMLLYGPPGCGKTLIARQIGKALNSRPPKIINGPQILDKFVGGSEEKIRELFADAEKEQAEMGDQSMLHIIIFDEMDAIMKTRGSTNDNTGVQDSIVNQLLSKIDGVDSLNNILIIGMTNRKDLIDEAILRAGRLELHVEIGLPDEAGRTQIINIHTKKMRSHNRMTQQCIDFLPEVARRTKNFTGAEIEGLVRSAVSYSLSRNIDTKELKAVDESSILVDVKDFERSLTEIVPAFGQKDGAEMSSYFRNGIYNYGKSFTDLHNNLERLVNQTRTSQKTPLLTVLLEGASGTGKTALAAKVCMDSGFPLVRLISPDTMIGMSETQKCQVLLKTFSDAYRSQLGVILIDDIERLIEYTPIGHRFQNAVLQTLMILLRKVPPIEGRRLMIIATTGVVDLMTDLQLTRAFSSVLSVTNLQTNDEFRSVLEQDGGLSPEEIQDITGCITKPIGIKQLLMVLEMARSDSTRVTPAQFLECLETCGGW